MGPAASASTGAAGGRQPGRTAATGRSARRRRSAPAARWAARCRPSPSGRRPSLPRIRWKRATVSVWVYEKTCPMCSSPDTVGGGVSIAYTSARPSTGRTRTCPPPASGAPSVSSSPSRVGRSGTPARAVLAVSVMRAMRRHPRVPGHVVAAEHTGAADGSGIGPGTGSQTRESRHCWCRARTGRRPRPARRAGRPRRPPPSSTSTRSAISTVESRCAITIAVRSARIVPQRPLHQPLARDVQRRGGLVQDQHRRVGQEARANATSCRCPAESRPPRLCTSVA